MVKYIIKFSGLLFFPVFLSACSSSNSKPLLIVFSADSSALVFSNIDQAGLLHLKNAPVTDSVFKSIISVLQIASVRDTTTKEIPVEGQIAATDSTLVFIPAKPFVKGSDYLVVTYLNSRFGSIEKVLKSKMDYGIKPKQQVLSR